MKRAFLCLSLSGLLGGCAVHAPDAQKDSWFHTVPSGTSSFSEKSELPAALYFEVAASRLGTAEYWLERDAAIQLRPDSTRYFGQWAFLCPLGTAPYLVRAVYENGGTGAFSLFQGGGALLIQHASLGAANGIHRTALVVCLRERPTEVFHVLYGAL